MPCFGWWQSGKLKSHSVFMHNVLRPHIGGSSCVGWTAAVPFWKMAEMTADYRDVHLHTRKTGKHTWFGSVSSQIVRVSGLFVSHGIVLHLLPPKTMQNIRNIMKMSIGLCICCFPLSSAVKVILRWSLHLMVNRALCMLPSRINKYLNISTN